MVMWLVLSSCVVLVLFSFWGCRLSRKRWLLVLFEMMW